jgi:hypothetical protein
VQTPRGFLIGAGVIAAIAALTSIGHPQSEVSVKTTAPIVTDAIEDTTTSTSVTTRDPEVRVRPEHVDAANGPDAASSTTIELNGAPEPAPAGALSTPAAESHQDAPPTPTTAADGGEIDGTDELRPTTTVGPTTTTPPTTTPPTTLPPPTTTVPTVTTTLPSARVTLPGVDTNVPRVTLPPIPLSAMPVVPTPPK